MNPPINTPGISLVVKASLHPEGFEAGLIANGMPAEMIAKAKKIFSQMVKKTSPPSEDYKTIIGDVKVLLADTKPLTEEKLCRIYNNIFLFAGRTGLNPGFCSICLTSGTLAESHIIPKNILSSLDTCFISSLKPNELVSAANVKSKLFCTPKCEVERLSKWGENNFAQIFHKFIDDVADARLNNKSASLITSDQSVHYCVASIIFRHIIMNGKTDLKSSIDLEGPKVEEAFWRFFFLLRNYVLDKDSPHRPHIQLFINEEELQKKTLSTTICSTSSDQTERCYTTGHFSFKGFHFLVAESSEVMNIRGPCLPPNGFSETITPGPQTIVVRSEHLLALPRIVIFALEMDFIRYKKTLARVNGTFLGQKKPTGADTAPTVSLPLHPLQSDPQELYSMIRRLSRLPDNIVCQVNKENFGELIFTEPLKYEIVFSQVIPLFQIWLIRNKPAKQVFTVMNNYGLNWNFAYGFSLNQELFTKSDLPNLLKAMENTDKSALRTFLKLTPLSRTDHSGLESITQHIENEKFIAKSIICFWAQTKT